MILQHSRMLIIKERPCLAGEQAMPAAQEALGAPGEHGKLRIPSTCVIHIM